jgi:hypothetical protein
MLRKLRSVLIGFVGLIFPFVSGNSVAASVGEPPNGIGGAASPNLANGDESADTDFASLGHVGPGKRSNELGAPAEKLGLPSTPRSP